MSAELLDAHQRGDVRVVIGRASDFVGPGVRDSAFGEFIFEPALAGKRAQTMGRPDTAAHLQLRPRRRPQPRAPRLARRRRTAGCGTSRTRRPARRGTSSSTSTPRPAAPHTSVTALKRPMLRALGLFNRNVRELLHTYYQFDAPFVVDDSAFRDAFGGHTTSWDEIVASTVDWYRTHAVIHAAPPVSQRPQPRR